jgi:hypothetical protein
MNTKIGRDQRGVAAAEFAIVGTVILFVMAGLFDIGSFVQQRLVLEQAVRAGGQYAQSFPNQTNGIIAAVNGSLPWTSGVNVSVTTCFCSQGSQSDACGTVCAGSTGSFIQITASRNFSPMMFLNPDSSGNAANTVSYVIEFQ